MRPHIHSERGSLPMVLLVAIIVGGIVVALFAEVSMGQATAARDRDMSGSMQVADAGLQTAFSTLARLDPADEDLPDLGGTLTGDGDVNEGQFDWTARRVGHERWQVRAEGTYRNHSRAVEAMVGAITLFPHAAFADQKIELRGDNLASSYDGIEWGTGAGSVGSNGEVTLRGNAEVDWVYRYGEATYGGGGTVNEGVEVVPEDQYMPNVGEEAYAEDGPCHDTDPEPYAAEYRLEYGETYCFSNVEFPAGDHYLLGNAEDGEVTIYIAPSGNLELKGQGQGNKSRTNIYPEPPAGFPDSSKLQIYLASGEVIANNHSEIAAGIYGPTSTCSGPDAQGKIYGSLICRNIDNKGGWEFHYDERLGEITAEVFDISNWREELMGTTSFSWDSEEE